MFLRMLKRSFLKSGRTKLLAILTIALGASLASAVLSTSLDIGDKVNKELKGYGANLMVLPQVDTLPVQIPGMALDPPAEQRYIPEDQLSQIKMIFWRNNILDFVPYLSAGAAWQGQDIEVIGTWFNKDLVIPTGETVTTGVENLKSWWEVTGDWPADEQKGETLVAEPLAVKAGIKPGDTMKVQLNYGGEEFRTVVLKVSGIVDTGGEEGDLILSLDWLQTQVSRENQVEKVEISALTTPENELARKAERDLESLSGEEFERWYCTAYVESIAYQVEEAIPGVSAKQIRQVAQSEGKVLGKIQILMALLTVVALVSSVLGISNLMSASVLERSKEIGLMKALGASGLQVALIFLAEAVLLGLIGGTVGYVVGFGFAQIIGQTVFSAAVTFKLLVVPLVLLLSVGVGILGTVLTMGNVLKLQPAEVLHGR